MSHFAATVAEADFPASACFSVHARAEAGVMPRVLELFAKRGFPTEVRNGKNVGFFHGTGHGLGLEIHEYPRLQKVTLKDRQVLTVEPGLYYPGLGGARQEDVVVVTKIGCKILSRFPKQLAI